MRARGESLVSFVKNAFLLIIDILLPFSGGAGGKGTWGRPGSELVGVEEGLEDPHDPNYDSDSEVCIQFFCFFDNYLNQIFIY